MNIEVVELPTGNEIVWLEADLVINTIPYPNDFVIHFDGSRRVGFSLKPLEADVLNR
jgi:hypothetical protein